MTGNVAAGVEQAGEFLAARARDLRSWYALADPPQRYLADCIVIGILMLAAQSLARMLVRRPEPRHLVYDHGYRTGYMDAIRAVVGRLTPDALARVSEVDPAQRAAVEEG